MYIQQIQSHYQALIQLFMAVSSKRLRAWEARLPQTLTFLCWPSQYNTRTSNSRTSMIVLCRLLIPVPHDLHVCVCGVKLQGLSVRLTFPPSLPSPPSFTSCLVVAQLILVQHKPPCQPVLEEKKFPSQVCFHYSNS